MVHPDYDFNGLLIDRTSFENGNPAGNILKDCVMPFLDNDIISYRDYLE